ncbi:Metalloenzyme, LuxS/M16 peptidase-like protein [Trichophaea hybrida]|nr:Metalloenzyme, LuxS/M16 peptidase-like protein [Trichophaea hybrida]
MLRGGLLLGRKAIGRRTGLLSRIPKRSYATALTNLRQLPQPGDKLHGFTVQRAKSVPELQLAAIELKHDKTGADYIHVARDDKNNVFAIGFKTNPNDDTGVPHILEHTTLCGSEKYPVRDPFFKMLNRSLSNYMNAFTSGDHTTYPFATTNRVDFNNLMDVYLDATLKPLLQESDFKQEGWRIGPENPADPKSPLLFKGVVYNEMKGQMSDSSYLYYIRFQDHIFPDLHNSGGDPQKITDLTLEQLRKFHKDHYNPSNAKIFTYGDAPIEEHLNRLNEKLAGFERSTVDKDLRESITLTENKSITVEGPIDPLTDKDAQYKTSVSWIMHDTTDVIETFSLKILSTYLLDGYGSPLYQGLIDEKLGSDFSPNTGFDTSSRKGIFSVGLQNVRQENLRTVQDKIHEVLRNVYERGFDEKKIEGILHQLELALKHKTATFGMSVMQGLTPGWFNGVDPFEDLAWEETVSKFKERYVQGGYLESLLKKYLLDTNTLTFTMAPDKNYGQALVNEEARRLAAELEKVGGESNARDSLVGQEMKLLEIQESARSQDLSCLPTLKVEDIPRKMEKKPLQHGKIGNVPVQWREAPTNGLTYFRAVNPLEDLPEELRLYLPLFTDAILRLGTATKSMEQLEDEIKLKTGGIKASTHVSTNHSSLEVTEEGLVFSGYCLDKNVPDMLELLRTALLETNFYAVSKLRTLIQGIASGFVNSLAESGHSFARTFAAAHLTPAAVTTEVMGGMTQVRLISNLAAKEIYNDALEKLRQIAQFAARQNGMRVAITCGSESVSDNERAVQKFVDSLPIAEIPQRTTALFDFEAPSKAFFPLPYQVSYTAMCLRTVPYTHRDGAALQLLSQLLTHKHLHHEIREKGGAYGGGAFHRGTGGIFGFYSYRDPNVANTLRVMEGAGEYALQRQWTERDLEEAKLSVFQGVDAPMSVSEEGMIYFLDGISDEMRQARREHLLDFSISDIREAAQKYLIDQIKANKTAIAVLGEPKDMYDEQWNIFPLSLDPQASNDASQFEKVTL